MFMRAYVRASVCEKGEICQITINQIYLNSQIISLMVSIRIKIRERICLQRNKIKFCFNQS